MNVTQNFEVGSHLSTSAAPPKHKIKLVGAFSDDKELLFLLNDITQPKNGYGPGYDPNLRNAISQNYNIHRELARTFRRTTHKKATKSYSKVLKNIGYYKELLKQNGYYDIFLRCYDADMGIKRLAHANFVSYDTLVEKKKRVLPRLSVERGLDKLIDEIDIHNFLGALQRKITKRQTANAKETRAFIQHMNDLGMAVPKENMKEILAIEREQNIRSKAMDDIKPLVESLLLVGENKNLYDPVVFKYEEEVEEEIHRERVVFDFHNFQIEFGLERDVNFLKLVTQQETIRTTRERLDKLARWRSLGVPDEEKDLEITGKYEPYDHQWVMYKVHDELNFSANLSEMGTGKTYGVLMAIKKKMERGDVRAGHTLIVCPNATVENWQRQIDLHTPELSSKIVRGSFWDRLQIMGETLKDGKHDILITNYETFSMSTKIQKGVVNQSLTGEEAQEKVTIKLPMLVNGNDWDMVVLDECHKAKNPDAQRTRGILMCFLAAKNKIIMSGTINANTLIDIYVPFFFLNKGAQFSSCMRKWDNTEKEHSMNYLMEKFRSEYFEKMGSKLVVQSKRMVKELRDLMGDTSVRYKKSECMDLPEKVYLQRQIDMHPMQRKLYNVIEEALFVDLKNYLDEGGDMNRARFTLQGKLMKLAEAANGWIYDKKGNAINFPWNPKIKELVNILQANVDLGKSKVVVWVGLLRIYT